MLNRVSLRSLACTLACLGVGGLAQVHENNDQCGCYHVQSNKSSEYFSNHRFYDFRYLGQNTSDYLFSAPNVTSTALGSSSQVLQTDAFTRDWLIQAWNRNATSDSPLPVYNNPQNIFVKQTNNTELDDADPNANSYLTFRTSRLRDFQSAAEMESAQKNFYYLSLRFHARVRGHAGACAGMFAVFDDNNESDVEILTSEEVSNTTTYHYTNQPSVRRGDEVPGASIQVNGLPSWTDWHTHRIDWLPGITRSFLDNVPVAENKVNVPKKPMFIDVNMWSDGGVWSGLMDIGNTAELQIQWIQVVFNTSGPESGPKRSDNKKRDTLYLHNTSPSDSRFPPSQLFSKRSSAKCSSICAIDGTNTTGVPVLVHQSQVGRKEASSAGTLLFAVLSIVLVSLIS